MLNRKPFLITLFMLAIGIPLHGAAIDSTLYTTYTLNGGTSLGYSVCGSTLQTSGCYSSGSLGPLGKIGAMLEGPHLQIRKRTRSPARSTCWMWPTAQAAPE